MKDAYGRNHMAQGDMLVELLLQARNKLEKARQAKMEGDNKTFSEKIWEVGADLEYFTFMVKLPNGKESPDDLWKEGVQTTRAVNIDGELSIAERLLQEASSAIESDFETAYKKAWLAQGHILKIQRRSEKTISK